MICKMIGKMCRVRIWGRFCYITTYDDPHNAWVMLETSYGSHQSGIQAVINAELTLVRWDGQTPITTFHNHIKALRMHLAAASLTITALQFYQHFINSLPAEYNMVVTDHNPVPSNYSIDILCEKFHAIELHKELHTTTTGGGTSEDSVALLVKQKGSKGSGRVESGHGGGSSGSKGKRANVTCYGCGKKGHYKHKCHSLKKQERGSQNTALTSRLNMHGGNAHSGNTHGRNAHGRNAHGGNAPANRNNLAKPARGTLLCLMELSETAYSATTDGRAQYYINTGASSHFIKEIATLHDYIPFEVPHTITTAKNGTIQAFGSGMLKFTMNSDGKEMKGEFHNVYYIPEIHHHLISVRELFTQGWEP